jgi:hypothetical protein
MEPTLTRADAIKAIQADRESRVKACGDELNALLDRHGCALEVLQVYRNGMPEPATIRLVARD